MKAAEPDRAAPSSFAQVSGRNSHKCPQLPKLRAPAVRAGSPKSQSKSFQKGTVARGFQLSSTSPRASSNSWCM